jgi:GNAT superfamily N-acetyltransferase
MSHPLPATTPAWTLTVVSYASPDARRLTGALNREQLATYGFADDPAGTPAGEFTAPHGTFLVAAAGGGTALACGGWRTAGPGTAEIKRMYVAPAVRGHGLGRRVDGDIGVLETEPPPGQREPRLVRCFLGADQQPVPAVATLLDHRSLRQQSVR